MAADGELGEGIRSLSVDQSLRQAILDCWPLLSENERSLRGLKNEIRRRLRRAYADLEERASAAPGASTGGAPRSEPVAAAPWEERLEQIRARHANAYQRWTGDEEVALARRFASGEGLEALALALQRQPGAIEARLRKPGLLE
jgi:hypothetical protein